MIESVFRFSAGSSVLGRLINGAVLVAVILGAAKMLSGRLLPAALARGLGGLRRRQVVSIGALHRAFSPA